MKKKVFIIAEIGVNHNGSIRRAKKLIDISKDCGADAVKFQTWKEGEITGKYTKNLNYIKKNLDKKISRYELSSSYRLTYHEFEELNKYCKKKKITFMSTPDGFDSLDFLCKKTNMPIIKIGSSELNHLSFISKICDYKKEIFISTGMGDIKEIRRVVNLLNKKNAKYTVLHCVSEYPTPINRINILSIKYLKNKLKVPVGLSDHTTCSTAAIMSVALGAEVVEKHITQDNSLKGPDHRASLNPRDFKKFVNDIRNAEKALGEYSKKPSKVEIKNIKNTRRGVVAKFDIKKGTILKENLLTSKRPYRDFQPFEIKKLIGKKVNQNLKIDQPILKKYII
jgi:N,N'-diacetyllegionaminate synthase